MKEEINLYYFIPVIPVFYSQQDQGVHFIAFQMEHVLE